VLLLTGVYKSLIKHGILVPVSQPQSARIVRQILNQGFSIAVLIILLGFAYVFYKQQSRIDPQGVPRVFAPQGNNDQNIDKNNGTAVQENK
jgi:hypothetical protein